MSTRLAEQAADKLLQTITYTIPVDVHAVASSCGLSITLQDLEDAVSGLLILTDGEGIIAVNLSHPKSRQRFSIAHEVGHWYLHRRVSSLFIDTTSVFFRDRDSAEGTSQQEMEANRFAAAILMPSRDLHRAAGDERLDPSDEATFRRLAAQFGVSVQALSIRLAHLGLLAI